MWKSLWDGKKKMETHFIHKPSTAMSEALAIQLCTATVHNHASQEMENIIL